jgi:hypothetical protein
MKVPFFLQWFGKGIKIVACVVKGQRDGAVVAAPGAENFHGGAGEFQCPHEHLRLVMSVSVVHLFSMTHILYARCISGQGHIFIMRGICVLGYEIDAPPYKLYEATDSFPFIFVVITWFCLLQ